MKERALIFDPYLDTLGGGERYILSFANTLAKHHIDVDIAWKDTSVLNSASKRFGQNYFGISISKDAYDLCTKKSNILAKYIFHRKYNFIFWVSDGSFPLLFGKKNFIHFQVPFINFAKEDRLKYLKNIFIDKYVCNSQFTKNTYKTNLPEKKLVVLYPPVDVKKFTAEKKQNWIVSVARFDSPLHNKRQDLLIDAFKKLNQKNKEYKLILVGGSKNEDSVSKYIVKAKGLPVDFVINPKFDDLKDIYAKSRFFWHGAGFDIDENKNPEKVEHFGITTVEAMASGCIPLVIKKGGQKEIIVDGQNGYLCTDDKDLAFKTTLLINDEKLRKKMVKNAVTSSEKFSLKQFSLNVKELLKK